MDSSEAIDLGRQALMLILLLGLPVLLTGLVVGLVVSVLQVVTAVQEHTLSFVPRIVAMLLALAVAGHWMLAKLTDFARQAFSLP